MTLVNRTRALIERLERAKSPQTAIRVREAASSPTPANETASAPELVGANNRLAVRYNIEDARDLNQLVGNTEDGGGIGTTSGGPNLFILDQVVIGTLSAVINPQVVSTALGRFARRHYKFPGASGEPDLDVPNDLPSDTTSGRLIPSTRHSRLAAWLASVVPLARKRIATVWWTWPGRVASVRPATWVCKSGSAL